IRQFFFSSRRRHTRSKRDWSSDVCSSDLSLQQAAELAGISEEEVKLLNASFKQGYTSPNGPHRLLVPVAQAGHFHERLQTATLHKPRKVVASNGQGQYTVQSGDSLSLIAQRFNTTVVALQQANGINNHHILVGQSLTIR